VPVKTRRFGKRCVFGNFAGGDHVQPAEAEKVCVKNPRGAGYIKGIGSVRKMNADSEICTRDLRQVLPEEDDETETWSICSGSSGDISESGEEGSSEDERDEDVPIRRRKLAAVP